MQGHWPQVSDWGVSIATRTILKHSLTDEDLRSHGCTGERAEYTIKQHSDPLPPYSSADHVRRRRSGPRQSGDGVEPSRRLQQSSQKYLQILVQQPSRPCETPSMIWYHPEAHRRNSVQAIARTKKHLVTEKLTSTSAANAAVMIANAFPASNVGAPHWSGYGTRTLHGTTSSSRYTINNEMPL